MDELLLPCSQHAQTVGEDPIGSAGTYEEYFLLEMALPWASDPWDSKDAPEGLKEHFMELEEADRSFRAMAIAAEEGAPPDGYRTFIHYRLNHPDGPVFERRSYRIPEAALSQTVIELTSGEADTHQPYLQTSSVNREFFVCTHGSRDQCCGSKGYPIFKALKNAGYRVWRISHTGGHRFAPTCIDFPTGHYWAWLTEDRVLEIANQSVDPQRLRNYYRGWSVLDPLGQVAERALFLKNGWASWSERRSVQNSLEKPRVSIHTPTARYALNIVERDPVISRAKCSSEMLKPYPQYEAGPLLKEGQHD
jgi:hypothetical protein